VSTDQHIPQITAHSEKWGDLPLFPGGEWIASDDDLEARNDILHMRALVDAIEHRLTPVLAHDVPAGFERDGRGLIDTAIDTHLDADWPDDAAAELLAAWRTETAAVSA